MEESNPLASGPKPADQPMNQFPVKLSYVRVVRFGINTLTYWIFMNYQKSNAHLTNLTNARIALKTMKRECDFCSKQFSISGISKHKQFCYLNPVNIKPCPVCTAPIKNYKTSVTCSSGCANTLFRTGPAHANWSDANYRSTCFYYHDKKCVVCGELNIIDVHHLDSDRTNNNPDNLIPLCPTHHQYWHSSYRKHVESIILDYIKAWKVKANTMCQADRI